MKYPSPLLMLGSFATALVVGALSVDCGDNAHEANANLSEDTPTPVVSPPSDAVTALGSVDRERERGLRGTFDTEPSTVDPSAGEKGSSTPRQAGTFDPASRTSLESGSTTSMQSMRLAEGAQSAATVAIPPISPQNGVLVTNVVRNNAMDNGRIDDPVNDGAPEPEVVVDRGCTGIIPDAIVRADATGRFEPSNIQIMIGAIVRFEPDSVTSVRSASGGFQTTVGDVTCLTFNRLGVYAFDAWTNELGRGSITVTRTM